MHIKGFITALHNSLKGIYGSDTSMFELAGSYYIHKITLRRFIKCGRK
jgi:hypothetical protein